MTVTMPAPDKLRCGNCGDDLTLEEIEGHLETEGRQTPRMRALDQINDIRNQVIGSQSAGWSSTIYPLVAALNAAGIRGMDWGDAKMHLREIEARVKAAYEENSPKASKVVE